jgi:sulfate adenylyltransferase
MTIPWVLTPRQLCDLELLGNGGFAPLRGFLTRDDYQSVVTNMRLASGEIWPIPIVLDVDRQVSGRIALHDEEGTLLATMDVEECWKPDRMAEAEAVYGTTSREHPGVAALLDRTHEWYVGGAIEMVRPPSHRDFRPLRLTPREVREEIARRGWAKVLAFQTRNPMHRAHFEITRRAMEQTGAALLLHPTVGMTKPGDVDHVTRVHCYQHVLPHYPEGRAMLSLLPLSMRMAGPREALWHALIRKNFGATHFVVGRDHAGPGGGFYAPFAAQELATRHAAEIGIEIVAMPVVRMPEGELSGTELRRRLAVGEEIPEWFTFPAVAEELRKRHRPNARRGFTVFMTGLSAAGKSTIAQELMARLLDEGSRAVTMLDGDVVRRMLSSELGFSKEHRDLNIRRIAWVAAQVTKSGGAAICAPIAPYDATRKEARRIVGEQGRFVLVHIATPIEACEARDPKGLYAKARAGVIPHFTGITDPYEPPEDAEIVIDASVVSPEEAAERILELLRNEGYLSS